MKRRHPDTENFLKQSGPKGEQDVAKHYYERSRQSTSKSTANLQQRAAAGLTLGIIKLGVGTIKSAKDPAAPISILTADTVFSDGAPLSPQLARESIAKFIGVQIRVAPKKPNEPLFLPRPPRPPSILLQ